MVGALQLTLWLLLASLADGGAVGPEAHKPASGKWTGSDNGGRSPMAKSPKYNWLAVPRANRTAADGTPLTALQLSTEAVLLPGVFDAAVESSMAPSKGAMPRSSPLSDQMEVAVPDKEHRPCEQLEMPLSEVYGADVADDEMTGGIRGISLSYPPNPVPLLPVPDQQTVTDKCDPGWRQRVSRQCEECARRFQKAGGCLALIDTPGDISIMVPWGCGHCEYAAAALCHGDDEKLCPRLRLRGVPAQVPQTLPEFLLEPEPLREPYAGPRSDRVPCPPPRIRKEKQVLPGPEEPGKGDAAATPTSRLASL